MNQAQLCLKPHAWPSRVAVRRAFAGAALGFALQGAALAQVPIDAKALLPDPAHRAIFCGTDGGDASAAYSQAVSKAITTVIERKAAPDVPSAIKLLKSQLCPAPTK